MVPDLESLALNCEDIHLWLIRRTKMTNKWNTIKMTKIMKIRTGLLKPCIALAK